MGNRVFYCVCIFLLGAASIKAEITQTPRYLVTKVNQEVKLSCEEDLKHDHLYWYQQEPQKEPKFMFYFAYQKMNSNENIPQRFRPDSPDKGLLSLHINSVKAEDSAIYFCSSSAGTGRAGAQLHFGAGTRLTVLDDLTKVTPPKVTVFQPSEEEIERKGKATLVCLATGFYPDLVELTWWVNGEETKIGVSTDPQPSKEQPQNSFSYYTLSSRLRVSAPFWRNPKNSFRCQVLFHGISENETWPSNEGKPITQNVSDQTWGRADCGVTSESYQRSIQSATIFYEILLGKALLYSLLVSVLVWRTKDKKYSS